MPENIKGLDSKGVFCLKTLKDAQSIVKRAQTSDHVVMLGGGILNLKAGFALLEKKLKVTLIVHSPEVLSRLMDTKDVYLVRNALDKAGLKIITGCAVTEVITDANGVCAIALNNGSEIKCEMMCVGKGVIPNLDFIENNSIEIDKGILTDKYTLCSAKDCFAAGDVAVTHDSKTKKKIVTSLWTHAVEMGICAGLNMAGIRTAYCGTFGIMNATQIAGEPIVSMGIVHTKNTDLETYVKACSTTLRKIVFFK